MNLWCEDRRIDRGAVVPLEQVWRLSGPWYADRLDYTWTPRTPAVIAELFTNAGLTGEFWRVP